MNKMLKRTTKRQMEQAFEAWENDFRIDPAKYRTLDEIRGLSVSQVSAERADYFFELLTLEQQYETND